MPKSPKNPQELYEPFARDMESLFPGAVLSLVAYGSAETSAFRPGESDLNFLVVLKDDVISDLRPAVESFDRWSKKGVGVPLFLSPSYLRSSLDTFPIEFLNMKRAYRVIRGDDPFASMTLDPGDFRVQAERELKGKLLQLRQGYLSSRGKPERLRELALISFKDFRFLFHALAVISGTGAGLGEAELITAVCGTFGVPVEPFRRLLEVREGGKVPKEDWHPLFREYIDAVRELGLAVDAYTSG